MLTSKSITFDEQEMGKAASVAVSGAYSAEGGEFIERLRAGEAAAFDNLINRFSSEIYGLLYRLTDDAEEAADLTQETFLKALRSITSFRGEADLKTWLYRIAVNESRNRFRWWKRRRRETTFSLDVPTGRGDQTFADILADGGEDPEAALIRVEREIRLRRALIRLPAAFREVVILRDIKGLSYEEVATAVDANLGTVKSRIARGREELRKLLGDF